MCSFEVTHTEGINSRKKEFMTAEYVKFDLCVISNTLLGLLELLGLTRLPQRGQQRAVEGELEAASRTRTRTRA